MPSLRKRVTSYFRQLSFHNEPRDKRPNVNENSFVTRYLQGQVKLKDGPPVLSGKSPSDLPNYDLDAYSTGPDTIVGCYTGPDGGLTTVKRTEKHLSVADPDIDFIDTQEEANATVVTVKSPNRTDGLPIDNTSMVIKVAGQEYFVTNRKKRHSKSQSLGSLSDFNVEVETTRIHTCNGNNGCSNGKNIRSLNDVKNSVSHDDFGGSCVGRSGANAGGVDLHLSCNGPPVGGANAASWKNERCRSDFKTPGNEACEKMKVREAGLERNELGLEDAAGAENVEAWTKQGAAGKRANYNISKSKSEGNPFQQHAKRGKIIRVQRPTTKVGGEDCEPGAPSPGDFLLPEEWSAKSVHVYGVSDSLYDRNQVTKARNGEPIADCFGVIAREDSAVLAVADGVNWGEKACVAAKSAVHGCLHYLNKTIFNDAKAFENLVRTDSKEAAGRCATPLHSTRVTNTQEVFVCLLRAFNCAHDLILENEGMLTTLTVAVVLPLKRSNLCPQQPPHRTTGCGQVSDNRTEPASYVCCVCNVGDTLAYVYSQKCGVREITKGSHDVHCNRDMRDALGALGPVDGINPELSNLTLSLTMMQKGDIVFVASDGLTDNFDPNVCKFSVNANPNDPALKARRQQASTKSKEVHPALPHPALPHPPKAVEVERPSPKRQEERGGPPMKPPRRHHAKTQEGRRKSPAERVARRGSEDGGCVEVEITRTIEEITKIVNRKSADEQVNPNTHGDGSDAVTASESSNNTARLVHNLTTDLAPSSGWHNEPCHDPVANDSNIVGDGLAGAVNNFGGVKGGSHQPKTGGVVSDDLSNPLVAQFIRDNSIDEGDSLAKCKQSVLSDGAKKSVVITHKSQHKVTSGGERASKPGHHHDNVQHRSDRYDHNKPIRKLSGQHQANQVKPGQQNLAKTMSMTRAAPADTPKVLDGRKPYFLRSKTSLDLRPAKAIARNDDGIPYVTPIQRYELTLLLMEDVLVHGISGREAQCVTARRLCENLMSFTFSITAAKRHTLEDNDLYFDSRNGVLVEVSAHEKKLRRKRGLEKVQGLPGKLDHVTVVAFNVGDFSS